MIIEKKWELLGDYFTQPGMGSKSKSNKLGWLRTFNAIRQKYSHPQREHTTEKEYRFLVEIKDMVTNLSQGMTRV